MTFNTYALFLTCLLLASCSTIKSPSIDSMPIQEKKKITYEQRANKLLKLTHWTARGRLAVKEDNKGFSASINWRAKSPSRYNINLYGPFGAGHITLNVTPEVATLKDNKTSITSQNPQSLLRKETGHTIPIGYMNYWLKGIAKPGTSANKTLDKQKRLTRLSQAGWHIQFLRYSKAHGFYLPAKIRLAKGNMLVKIIINRWY